MWWKKHIDSWNAQQNITHIIFLTKENELKKLSEYTFDDGTVDGPEYLTFIYGTDESGNETKKKQSKSQFHFSDWVKGILFFCFFFFGVSSSLKMKE